MLDFLVKYESDIERGNTLHKKMDELVRDVSGKGIFPNQLTMARYVSKKLGGRGVPISVHTVRGLLFHRKRYFTMPWHYNVVEILEDINSGRADIGGYAKPNFTNYRFMLRFALNALVNEQGLEKNDAIYILAQAIGIAPSTLLSGHLYAKQIPECHYARFKDYSDRLIEFIKDRILITINLGVFRGESPDDYDLDSQLQNRQGRSRVVIEVDRPASDSKRLLAGVNKYFREKP